METEEKILTRTQLEKERLEIVEKKVEIQKKRIELKKEKLDADEFLYKRKVELDEQKSTISKISELRILLADYTIDEERTIIGGEPFFKPLLDQNEKEIIIKKILELVRQI